MRWTTEQYKEYLSGKIETKEKPKTSRTICPACEKFILATDSFICEVIEGTNPVEVKKTHLMCGLKNNN